MLYVYDIQLEPEAQRKGLGKFMMQLMELIARRAQMEWVMLTVLKVRKILSVRGCVNEASFAEH